MRRSGSQPILFAASTLTIIVIGLGSIVAWRAYTGTSPEQDRVASARQTQARAAQASQELIEKTKALETSQQATIEEVQTVAEQLQVVKRLLSAQQAETKRLTEQVSGVAESVDTLRQSFASAKGPEASAPPRRKRLSRSSTRVDRKLGKSHGRRSK